MTKPYMPVKAGTPKLEAGSEPLMDDKTPKRIQRKRTKGWKMPEGAVAVTSARLANPFRVGTFVKLGPPGSSMSYLMCWEEKYATAGFERVTSVRQAIDLYREVVRRFPLSEEILSTLRGKDLACYCRLDQPCHADVLLEIANRGTDGR